MQSSAVWRSQAIPMAEYRRRIVLNQIRPYPLLLSLALVAYRVAVYLWGVPMPLDAVMAQPPASHATTRDCSADAPDCIVRPPLTDPDLAPPAPPQPAVGTGVAPLAGIGSVSLTNIKIAVGLIDGTVIQPGEKFSFDDTARTWDFQEDPRYLMSAATSLHGIIYMRGGGVCWLSTALWHAALNAGLPTDFRQNHYGLVPLLGPGLDATNTLVFRNDSDEPVTVHAWMDGSDVHAELLSPYPLDRTAVVDGPYAQGSGSYVTYQEITWDDGTEATNVFPSHYYW